MKRKSMVGILLSVLILAGCAGCKGETKQVSTDTTGSAISTVSTTASEQSEQSKAESSKEESSKQESSKESSKQAISEVSEASKEESAEPKKIDRYEYASFDKYNSYASENGLGDTLVYINAVCESVFSADGNINLNVKSDDSGEWLLGIGYESLFPVDETEDLFKGKQFQCFGTYTGWSDTYKKPCITVTKIVCNDKEYNYFPDKNTDKSYLNNITFNLDSFVGRCKPYTYKEMARKPNDYLGKAVKLKGEVIQVTEEGLDVTYRVNITFKPYSSDSADGYYEDTVYVYYHRKNENESRILEDDIVEIYGVSSGNISYTTVMGAEKTLPGIVAYKIDVKE